MRLDKVYIGYTRDYKEHLLEERENYYLDLLTDNLIFEKDLLLGLLKPISVLDKEHKRLLLSRVKKLYEKDRNRTVDTTKLFIGDVNKIIKLNHTENFHKTSIDTIPHADFTTMVIKVDALLYKINKRQYRNIKTNEEYIIPFYPIEGSLFIDEEKLVDFNNELLQTNIKLANSCGSDIVVNQTKKKVLESYHYILGNK